MFRIKYTIGFVLSYKYFQIKEILTTEPLVCGLPAQVCPKCKVLDSKLFDNLKPNTQHLKTS